MNSTLVLISKIAHGIIPNLPLFHLPLFMQNLWLNLHNPLLMKFAYQHSLLKLCKLLEPKPRRLLFV